ncbi:MAG: hypothetical protein V4547_16830 [Bacteroidota bacterium]
MKKWDASDYCLVILASTIPLSIIILPIMRAVTHQTLSDNASSVMNNLMMGIGVGILTVIAQKYKNKQDDNKPTV